MRRSTDCGSSRSFRWSGTTRPPTRSKAFSDAKAFNALSKEQREEQLIKQGRTPYGVQIQVRTAQGGVAPQDGKAFGPLMVKGPWVASGYFKGEGGEVLDAAGWFPTGDVATWDEYGCMKITDRTKDVIKSGGEWISSVDMERELMAMAEVQEAAVIAIPDPKWQERPLACLVVRPGQPLDVARVREHLAAKGFAAWQLPDRIEIIEAVPKTSVGKFDKKALRARFAPR